jgi:hypothetical protein
MGNNGMSANQQGGVQGVLQQPGGARNGAGVRERRPPSLGPRAGAAAEPPQPPPQLELELAALVALRSHGSGLGSALSLV